MREDRGPVATSTAQVEFTTRTTKYRLPRRLNRCFAAWLGRRVRRDVCRCVHVVHTGSRVSDVGLTGNSILGGNTSRNLAVAADGTIYAVFSGTNGIRVAASTDRGQTFGASVLVSVTNFEPEVAVSSTGIIYVGWIDSATTVKISRSLDGGKTFSAPVDAGTTTSGASSVHMATDANMLYVVERYAERVLTSSNNGLTFTDVPLAGGAQAFSDLHVDLETGDVFVQVDDPTVSYYISTDQGADFGSMLAPTPGGSIMYSVGAVSSGPAGRFLFISGTSTTAMKIDLDTGNSSTLAFGNNSSQNGRSLMADRYGNIVDGYVTAGNNLEFHVSSDLGANFGSAQIVAAVPAVADRAANVFIDQTNGNLLFLYTQSGEVFLNVYQNELLGYSPALSTSTLVFSAQIDGTTSKPRSVKLTNTGASALNVTGVSIIGDFAFAGADCSGTLAAGASCDLPVKFSPNGTGSRTGCIEIQTDAFAQPRVVKLSGLGVTSAPVPEFDPAPLDFGKRAVNGTHEMTVKLRNAGTLDLAVNGFTINGAFTQAQSCPATLVPSASCDVTIEFAPTDLVDYSGTLTLDSNAPGAPATLALSGIGAKTFTVTTLAVSNGTITPTREIMEGESAGADRDAGRRPTRSRP